jgi:hypothetical protein
MALWLVSISARFENNFTLALALCFLLFSASVISSQFTKSFNLLLILCIFADLLLILGLHEDHLVLNVSSGACLLHVAKENLC